MYVTFELVYHTINPTLHNSTALDCFAYIIAECFTDIAIPYNIPVYCESSITYIMHLAFL